MDRLIYTAMSGAKSLLDRQAVVANNLANISTPGYRAETSAFQGMLVKGQGLLTRELVTEGTTGADFTPGPLLQTGRDLDTAIHGKGWIAVQGADGNEAYTRGGSFRIGIDGNLETHSGRPVLSDSGPIAIPPDTKIMIGEDGTISAVPTQPPLTGISVVGRIKLVNPDEKDLTRGDDGLFRVASGNSTVDETVKLVSGVTEGSNVNPAEAMVSMINVARQFELQMRMLQNAQNNAQQADQILTINV